jgi:hypothetical protein
MYNVCAQLTLCWRLPYVFKKTHPMKELEPTHPPYSRQTLAPRRTAPVVRVGYYFSVDSRMGTASHRLVPSNPLIPIRSQDGPIGSHSGIARQFVLLRLNSSGISILTFAIHFYIIQRQPSQAANKTRQVLTNFYCSPTKNGLNFSSLFFRAASMICSIRCLAAGNWPSMLI